MMEQDAKRSGLYWKLMATQLHKAGRLAEALRIYRQAILMNPEDADLCFNLGNLLRTIGQSEKAIGVYELAHRINSQDIDILINLAPLYRSSQRPGDARRCYQKILQLAPDDPTAHYFLAALDGKSPDRAPAAMVVELFDQYAPTYDQHMNKTLKYLGPELLRSLLLSYAPTRHRVFKTCDLGCGTGRSIEAFEHLVSEVDGFDLSPVMLAHAAVKKLYRHLYEGDCLDQLQEAESYELFLAADLVPYFGRLEPLFACVRKKAESPAFLLMSTEYQTGSGEPQLQLTGRFQHSFAYVLSCIHRENMHLRAFRCQALRQQGDQAILSGLYLVEI